MSRKAILRNVVNKHWVSAQATDPVIRLVWEWMARSRENKISLSEHLNGKVADTDCLAFVCHQKDLRMSHSLLYMETHAPGTDENIFAFVAGLKVSYFFLLFGVSPTFSYFRVKFLLFPTF